MARKKNNPASFDVPALLAAVVVGGLAVATLIHRANDAEAGQGQINDRGRICMLQDTVQARSDLTYFYKYYLCCGDCLAAFQRARPA